MKIVSKTVTGALAAAMLTTALASPAEARHRRGHRSGNGISLGDVVLGTIAVAGVATVVGALSEGNRRRYDDRYSDGRYGDRGYDDGYGRVRDDRDYGRQASLEACAFEAEREAGRRFGSRAVVQDIDVVDRTRSGYRVRGSVEVEGGYRGGYDRYARGSERVQFTCSAQGSRVTDLRIASSYAQGY